MYKLKILLGITLIFFNTLISASLIEYNVSGIMTGVDNDITGTFKENGVSVNISYTLDLDTPAIISSQLYNQTGFVERTNYNNIISNFSMTVGDNLPSAYSDEFISSQLTLFNDELVISPNGPNFLMDRYILTAFGINGFGFSDPLYFIQLDIFEMAFDINNPSNMLSSDFVSAEPPVPSNLPNQWGYSRGRIAPTSDNRNIEFDVNEITYREIVVEPITVSEPSIFALLIAGIISLGFAHSRKIKA